MCYIDLVACVVCECDLPMVTWAAGRISVTWPGLVCLYGIPGPSKKISKIPVIVLYDVSQHHLLTL